MKENEVIKITVTRRVEDDKQLSCEIEVGGTLLEVIRSFKLIKSEMRETLEEFYSSSTSDDNVIRLLKVMFPIDEVV